MPAAHLPRPGRESARAGFVAGLYLAGTLALWLPVAAAAWYLERRLGTGELVTGYALLVFTFVLAAFNLRKRLPALPLGSARAWKRAHLAIGAIATALYVQHAGSPYPMGRYEQLLALVFCAVVVSGLLGDFLQRLLPRRLTDVGGEVIFERIPAEIATLREQAEALVLASVREAGSGALSQYYVESLDWYFRRPRFLLSHLTGGNRGGRWIRDQISALRRYLDEREGRALDQIEALALRKNQLDAHYVLQGALKLWLFVHVPAGMLLVALACWHLLVLHIYAL